MFRFHTQKNIFFFWSLITGVAVMVSMYVYSVNTAILHTAQRQEVQNQIAELRSEISGQQGVLLAKKQEITRSDTEAFDLIAIEDSLFVYRSSDTRLSLR